MCVWKDYWSGKLIYWLQTNELLIYQKNAYVGVIYLANFEIYNFPNNMLELYTAFPRKHDSSQVKRDLISDVKTIICESADEFSIDLKLRVLIN